MTEPIVRTLFGFQFVDRSSSRLERFTGWFEAGKGRWVLAQWLCMAILFCPLLIGSGISRLFGVEWPLIVGGAIFLILFIFVLIPGITGGWS